MSKPSHPSNPLALAVLALLFERPMHPYEMAATLKERRKHESIKLRYGSLYTVIGNLLARGFITPKETSRDGKRPERTVYAVTESGAAGLRAWMRDLVADPVKEYPQFEAGLCLLPVLPPDEAVALLNDRLTTLSKTIKEMESHFTEMGSDFPALFTVESEYRLAMLKAEERFVEMMIERIGKGWGPLELWREFHEDRDAALAKARVLVEKAIARMAERQQPEMAAQSASRGRGTLVHPR